MRESTETNHGYQKEPPLRLAETEERWADIAAASEFVHHVLVKGIKGMQPDLEQTVLPTVPSEWDLVTEIATSYRVAPLLYQELKDQSIVPTTVRMALQREYLGVARRNLFLFHELNKVLEHLNEAGIQTLVLKGAALAETIYGNIALRPMGDIDLLVSPEDAARALDSLADAGYVPGTEPQHGMALVYENEVALHKPGMESYLLEIHWALFDSPFYQQMPLDWFWQTRQVVETPTGSFYKLSPSAEVLYLCGHLALHHAHEPVMLWLNDLAMILEHQQEKIDWSVFLEQTEAYHLVLAVRKTLETLLVDWEAAVPLNVVQALQELEVSTEEQKAFAAQTAVNRPVAQRFWSDLSQMPTWRERLNYAGISLFPSPAYMRERYQAELTDFLPYLYLHRFWRGLRSGATAVRERLRTP